MTAALLRRPHRHDGRSRTPPPTPDAQPWFPWHAHPHNPRPAPAAPDSTLTHWQLIGRPPEAWPTQCRDCWGFVDDPRHFAFPIGPALTDQVTHH